LLARAIVPVAVFFILSACGGSTQRKGASSRVVHGPGFSFSIPYGWSAHRTERALVARRGNATVSATTFAILKPYHPAEFSRAAKELDRVAAKLAAQSGGSVTGRMTTTVDGRRIRAYDLATSVLRLKIGFVLIERREYQLLCQTPKGSADPDGACKLLFESFSSA
jgi:hypothetical protein